MPTSTTTVCQCKRSHRLPLRAGQSSDIDLLITAPDAWLEGRNRFEVLDELWGLLARADGALDLLLYSERECEERRLWRTHVIGRAFPGGAVAGWCSLSRKDC